MSFSHSNRKSRGSAIVGVLITLIVLLLVADTAVIALCFKTPSGTAAPHRGPHPGGHRGNGAAHHRHGNHRAPHHHAGAGACGIHRYHCLHR